MFQTDDSVRKSDLSGNPGGVEKMEYADPELAVGNESFFIEFCERLTVTFNRLAITQNYGQARFWFVVPGLYGRLIAECQRTKIDESLVVGLPVVDFKFFLCHRIPLHDQECGVLILIAVRSSIYSTKSTGT